MRAPRVPAAVCGAPEPPALRAGTCSIGAASACFDIARTHIRTRKQFGAPLSENQVRLDLIYLIYLV